MNQKIISTIIIFGLLTVIPTAYGQLSLGSEAKQELIEVKINPDGEINVKHVVSPSNMPTTVPLFLGEISNLIITDDLGEFQIYAREGDEIIFSSVQYIIRTVTVTNEIIKNKRLQVANQNLTEYEKRSRLPPFIQSLFDEFVRTPLLFSGYKMKPLIIKQQTRSIDIFPTVFDLLGFNYSGKIQGKSFLPLIRGDNYKENSCYMHTMPHEKLSDNDQVGIRTSKYKYFRHARNPLSNIHLYDLTQDTLENKNIYQENPEKIQEMEEIIAEFSNFENKEVIDDDEEAKIREELKRLGYL